MNFLYLGLSSHKIALKSKQLQLFLYKVGRVRASVGELTAPEKIKFGILTAYEFEKLRR